MKKPILRLYLTVVTLLIFFSSTTFATNYYVDPSSTSNTSNGSLASPWKTIAQVNSGTTLLNPGDTVFFKRGQTYSGRLTVGRSGIAGKPIVYTPYGTGALPEFNNAITDIIALTNRSYVVIDGIKFIDNSISGPDPLHQIQAKISIAMLLYNSPHCTISNCDFSLVGIGIATYTGSDYTTITGNYMHNMRMVKNTPTTVNNNDDYGANPMVLGSSYNTVNNNLFEECWALSYDYGYDGGAVELYGSSVNNNTIMYNTAINCNGFMEIGSGSGGVANNNVIAYNKIINCGLLGTFQNSGTFLISINNLQYLNNTVVETVRQQSSPSSLFYMAASTGPAGMVVLKNNIFWLSSGINFASSKFNTTAMVHSNNIFRMSSGTLGVTLNSSELLSSTANLFTNTTGTAGIWNYSLLAGSPAINFGIPVGYTKDFIGNPIIGNPDVGILEFRSSTTSPLVGSSTAGAISCNGGNTTVTVSASGGTAPYTGTGNFTVTAGTYNYTVTDAKGLTATTSIILSQPSLISATTTAGTIAINGGTTSVTVAAA
jgi:parallel beta-helix repeat protein